MSTEECVFTQPGKETMQTRDHLYFLIFTPYRRLNSPLYFIFLICEDVKQTDSLWLSPPEQGLSGSSLANKSLTELCKAEQMVIH